MSYCVYCGAKAREGAAICPVCGKPVSGASARRPDAGTDTRRFTGGRDPSAQARWESFTDVPIDDEGFEVLPSPPPAPKKDPVFRWDRAADVGGEPSAAYGGPSAAEDRQPQARRPSDAARYAGSGNPAMSSRPPSPAKKTARARLRVGDGALKALSSAARRVRESRPVSAAVCAVSAFLREHAPGLRRLRGVLLITAGALLLLVVLLQIVSGTGERRVAKQLAKAYITQKPEQIAALSGELMRSIYPEEGSLEEECRADIERVRSEFNGILGERYRLSYKIRVNDAIKGDALRTRLQGSFGDAGAEACDSGMVKEMTTVTVNLRAVHGGASAHKRIDVTLIRERGKWRLAAQLV